MADVIPDYMTVAEAAERLGWHRSTVTRALVRGDLAGHKLGTGTTSWLVLRYQLGGIVTSAHQLLAGGDMFEQAVAEINALHAAAAARLAVAFPFQSTHLPMLTPGVGTPDRVRAWSSYPSHEAVGHTLADRPPRSANTRPVEQAPPAVCSRPGRSEVPT
jgi:excisionase family DNA binding protein